MKPGPPGAQGAALRTCKGTSPLDPVIPLAGKAGKGTSGSFPHSRVIRVTLSSGMRLYFRPCSAGNLHRQVCPPDFVPAPRLKQQTLWNKQRRFQDNVVWCNRFKFKEIQDIFPIKEGHHFVRGLVADLRPAV